MDEQAQLLAYYRPYIDAVARGDTDSWPLPYRREDESDDDRYQRESALFLAERELPLTGLGYWLTRKRRQRILAAALESRRAKL